MLRFVAITAALFLACAPALADDRSEEIVSKYIDAYNDHDIDRMMTLVSDDVRWLEVTDDESYVRFIDGTCTTVPEPIVHTRNREELSAALESYFDTFLSARSIIRSMQSKDGLVTVVEEAVWDFAGVPMSQCATAIYEIDDGVIAGVRYFSEQPCEDESPEG